MCIYDKLTKIELSLYIVDPMAWVKYVNKDLVLLQIIK